MFSRVFLTNSFTTSSPETRFLLHYYFLAARPNRLLLLFPNHYVLGLLFFAGTSIHRKHVGTGRFPSLACYWGNVRLLLLLSFPFCLDFVKGLGLVAFSWPTRLQQPHPKRDSYYTSIFSLRGLTSAFVPKTLCFGSPLLRRHEHTQKHMLAQGHFRAWLATDKLLGCYYYCYSRF